MADPYDIHNPDEKDIPVILNQGDTVIRVTEAPGFILSWTPELKKGQIYFIDSENTQYPFDIEASDFDFQLEWLYKKVLGEIRAMKRRLKYVACNISDHDNILQVLNKVVYKLKEEEKKA